MARHRLIAFVIGFTTPLVIGEWFLRAHPELYSEGYRPPSNAQLVYELQPEYAIAYGDRGDYVRNWRSKLRYWIASARCSGSITSCSARSAIVRAILEI